MAMIREQLQRVYGSYRGDRIATNFTHYSLKGKNVKAYCRAKGIEYNEYMDSNKYDVDMVECDNNGYYSFIGAFDKVYKCQRLSTACDFE